MNNREPENASQQTRLANAAKNSEALTTRALSSVPALRLARFFAVLVFAGFVLNEIWEMAQMTDYAETAGRSWAVTFAFCTSAAAGDVAIILGIYAVGALAAGDPGWGLRGQWNVYPAAAILGLVYATLVEHAALATGRWSYAPGMPIVPGLGAGLWPLLQMSLLPPLTFLLAGWGSGRSSTQRS